ncbi:hypothetical protein [Microvirga roseola]|uniref:hypothetical protein n=1 Tax=Microvirga roseola TaxID=2883126 RepID=UPI001E5DD1EB|nr:hypothetical protein [Microvirga roseola]
MTSGRSGFNPWVRECPCGSASCTRITRPEAKKGGACQAHRARRTGGALNETNIGFGKAVCARGGEPVLSLLEQPELRLGVGQLTREALGLLNEAL